MSYYHNEKECPRCHWMYHISDYCNKDGVMIYSTCQDCRRKYIRQYQAERRKKIKDELSKAPSPQQMYQDTLKRLRSYLVSQAGPMCQPCGHDKAYNLTLINLDGISLRDALAQYADNMNNDNWMYIISIYSRCIEMCHNCAGMYANHDEALRLTDDMLWKANPKPQPPE